MKYRTLGKIDPYMRKMKRHQPLQETKSVEFWLLHIQRKLNEVIEKSNTRDKAEVMDGIAQIAALCAYCLEREGK